jgi:predicted aspartyl protease
VKITEFDPKRDLIIVESTVWGRDRYRKLSLAVDTASAATVVTPYVIEDIGYHPRDGIAITTVRSAIGKEQGYTLKVAQFDALGFVFQDFEVNVFDLVVGHDIDGLIGLSFLRHFDYEIRSLVGKITVRPAAADALPA